MGGDEDVALHLEDTMAAGDGAGEPGWLRRCWWRRGPQRVEELLEVGDVRSIGIPRAMAGRVES